MQTQKGSATIIVFIILLLTLGGEVLYFKLFGAKEKVIVSSFTSPESTILLSDSETVESTETRRDEAFRRVQAEEWNTFSDPRYGYSLKYPQQVLAVEYRDLAEDDDEAEGVQTAGIFHILPEEQGHMFASVGIRSGTLQDFEKYLRVGWDVATKDALINGKATKIYSLEYSKESIKKHYGLTDQDPILGEIIAIQYRADKVLMLKFENFALNVEQKDIFEKISDSFNFK